MTSALSISSQQNSSPNDGLSAFLSVRSRLFGIAYRMLGNAADAEDLVQDVWLRWQRTDRRVVRDTAAFLATTVTRLALNAMQSARARRETDMAPTQPEPADTSSNPGAGAEQQQALASGVRLLLQKLTPTERAAYILREAFDYAYGDIAGVLQLGEANARQVVTRARQHMVSARATATSSTDHARLLAAFTAASRDGDFATLEEFLAPEASFTRARPSQPVATSGLWF